ncbi:hypothetical protein C427_1078 [Paraglaciecola psychrophila 170]|uniref:Uncharacterized protein n=1 Tax=Paraglaciecola psychrophila 170 TaxID=1129794 RepID=M4RXI8_9ALTE|nr:hypothetical protein C427_1078 [Paraglaciecola psychrophila 170]
MIVVKDLSAAIVTKPPIIDFENQLQKKSFFCIEMDVID